MKQGKMYLAAIIIAATCINSYGQAWIASGSNLITNSATNNVGIHTTSPNADLNIVHKQGLTCPGPSLYPIIPAIRLDELNYQPSGMSYMNHNIFEIWYNAGACPPTITPGGGLLYSISVGDFGAIENIIGNISAQNISTAINVTVGNDINVTNNINSPYANITNTLTVPGIAVIGTSSYAVPTPAGYSLYVAQGILAEKLKVANSTDALNWSDFVFNKEYKLMPLNNLEEYLKLNKHLPEIPSAADVAKDGIDVAGMDAKLLQKIEELTLYVIQQQKEIDDLKKQMHK